MLYRDYRNDSASKYESRIRKIDMKARDCPGASMLFLLLQSQRPQTCLKVGDFDFAKSAALGYKGRELTPPVPNMPGMKPGTTAGNRNAFLSDQSDKLTSSETCGVLYPR